MMLDKLRNQIDEIDLQLKELFKRRMIISQGVAESKAKTGDKILKLEREEQVIEQLTEDIEKDLKPAYISFLKKVMEISRTVQYKKTLELKDNFKISCDDEEAEIKKICYQGLPGSYSEIATKKMFKGYENYSVETFEDVFSEIDSGQAQIGIVPLENTTAGGIEEVYDLLVKYALYINHCYIYKVSHCLCGIQGAELEDIKVVYSHPQAIAQSKEFLKSKGIASEISSNTAVAAKYVLKEKDKSKGAICSIEAAEKYGLDVLMDGINHNKENATKFVAISKKLISKRNHNRVSIVFACSNRSGSLASVLGIFADYGINLTEIHSRPDGKNPWEYLFYVDFTGNLMDKNIRALFFQLTEELPYIKILGSYKY